jgi:hypothetical protein
MVLLKAQWNMSNIHTENAIFVWKEAVHDLWSEENNGAFLQNDIIGVVRDQRLHKQFHAVLDLELRRFRTGNSFLLTGKNLENIHLRGLMQMLRIIIHFQGLRWRDESHLCQVGHSTCHRVKSANLMLSAS